MQYVTDAIINVSALYQMHVSLQVQREQFGMLNIYPESADSI